MAQIEPTFNGLHSKNPKNSSIPRDRGLFLFAHTSQVIRAQRVLQLAGYPVLVKGPPPQVRTGCDLAIEFPIVQQAALERALAAHKIKPTHIIVVSDPLLTPVELYQVTDYGDWLMVRAANMKITADKNTHVIVNVSGGGCPDVPWLALQLLGQPIESAIPPNHTCHTLCGYSLHMAFMELKRRLTC